MRPQARSLVLRLATTNGLLVLVALGVGQHAGCQSDAVGIEDCRDIEEARCEAAAHCGDQLPVGDVEACKRFYRDQCLHGLAVENDPSSGAVKTCVAAIVSAGQCAQVAGANTELGDCPEPGFTLFDETKIATACDVVEHPELTSACFFLNTTDEEPPTGDGEGGAAGAGSASAGSAGADAAGGAGRAGSAGTSP